MHYFVTPINDPTLIILEGDESCSSINGWVAFTEEQEEYYSEHPEISPYDLKNIDFDSSEDEVETVELPDEVKVMVIREKLIKELSEYSFERLHEIVKDYQVLNAYCVLKYPERESFYTTEEAETIMRKYNDYGTAYRNIYYSFVENVRKCETVDEVTSMFENYKNEYDKIIFE